MNLFNEEKLMQPMAEASTIMAIPTEFMVHAPNVGTAEAKVNNNLHMDTVKEPSDIAPIAQKQLDERRTVQQVDLSLQHVKDHVFHQHMAEQLQQHYEREQNSKGIVIHCLTGATLKLRELTCTLTATHIDADGLKRKGYWEPMYVIHEDGINWVVKGEETYHSLIHLLRDDRSIAAIEFPVVQVEGASLAEAEEMFKGELLIRARVESVELHDKVKKVLRNTDGVEVL